MDGRGGDATKDGGWRYAYPPYDFYDFWCDRFGIDEVWFWIASLALRALAMTAAVSW
jgi:hypothetical protein